MLLSPFVSIQTKMLTILVSYTTGPLKLTEISSLDTVTTLSYKEYITFPPKFSQWTTSAPIMRWLDIIMYVLILL